MAADLTDQTDVGLLLLIGSANDSEEDQLLANEAMQAFHRRHYCFVLRRIEGFAENLGTVTVDVDRFTAVTFQKAFRNAVHFKDTSNGDADIAGRKVRAWLGRIASNLALDELDRISRHRRGIQLVPLNELTDAIEEPGEVFVNCPSDPLALIALREFLASLKSEEQDILMTYATFGVSTPAGRELPKDVRDALEVRTGYERSNIRQKWRRLSQRLKSEIEPFLKNQRPTSNHA